MLGARARDGSSVTLFSIPFYYSSSVEYLPGTPPVWISISVRVLPLILFTEDSRGEKVETGILQVKWTNTKE
jgi:hypothetical protein